MFGKIHLAIALLIFVLSYVLSYAHFLRGRARSMRWLWLLILTVGFLIGLCVSFALMGVTFFGFAIALGPPLQNSSWLGYEKYGFYLVILLELSGIGCGTGKLSAKIFNRLSDRITTHPKSNR